MSRLAASCARLSVRHPVGKLLHRGGTGLALGSAIYADVVPGATADRVLSLGWAGAAVALGPIVVQVTQAIKSDREAERAAD